MKGNCTLDTKLKPLNTRFNPQPFTKAFALTADDGCSERGQLAFITDKSLYIEINTLEAKDQNTANTLLSALESEAIAKQIWQVRWSLTDAQKNQWASTLKDHGYQMTDGGMARWKNPSFNRDIAMGI